MPPAGQVRRGSTDALHSSVRRVVYRRGNRPPIGEPGPVRLGEPRVSGGARKVEAR